MSVFDMVGKRGQQLLLLLVGGLVVGRGSNSSRGWGLIVGLGVSPLSGVGCRSYG